MQLSDISKDLVALAIAEDIGVEDVTTAALISESQQGRANVIAKESLVVCGHVAAREVLQQLGANVAYCEVAMDGTQVGAGDVVATLEGPVGTIVSAERTILNFLQRLSGVATAVKVVTDKIKDSGVKILDTRKTTPGWRELEKYAVRVGGGVNHRMGLYDAVLIKNNHLDSFGGTLPEAVQKAREYTSGKCKIEVEVRDLNELKLAITASPDEVLLDNFTPSGLRDAVELLISSGKKREIKLEASGGITLQNVTDYAVAGIDYISMGQLTHSVIAKDLALRYQK